MLFKFRNEINVLNHYIFISLLLPLKTIIEVKCLAKKYAVIVLVIPIPKVIANPFTGPDPKANNIIGNQCSNICIKHCNFSFGITNVESMNY